MQITRFRKVDLGSTVAFFSVDVGDEITFNDLKLIDGSNGFFISSASREYTTRDGEKKYSPYIWFGRNSKTGKKILDAAVAKYQEGEGRATAHDDEPPF